MGIRGENPASPRKKLWKGLWFPCGQGRRLRLLSPVSLLSTLFVHDISTDVDFPCCRAGRSYPSVIFLRMSSKFRLNSASSRIMDSIRPQAEMAVVWSVRSKRMEIRL